MPLSRRGAPVGPEAGSEDTGGGEPGDADRVSSLRTLTAPDGATIAYRLWQPDRPRRLLVLLHGVASNMTRWSELVARTTLRDSWDLLRLDLRGQGASLHRGRIGMAEWCADLAGILDAEGYARAVVAGHCLGANIALEFGARHPGRASGLDPDRAHASPGDGGEHAERWRGSVPCSRPRSGSSARSTRSASTDVGWPRSTWKSSIAGPGRRSRRRGRPIGCSRRTPLPGSTCARPPPEPTCRRCWR